VPISAKFSFKQVAFSGGYARKLKPLGVTASLHFVGPFDLISIIHENIQNLICNSVDSCPHIIHSVLHQNQTQPDREVTI